MPRYILIRCLQALPVLFLVISITFFMIRAAPGGPFDSERAVAPEILQQLNARYDLDDPPLSQLGSYLLNLLQGDFGPSFRYPGRSVNELIYSGLPVTLELGVYALLFALLIGISTGVIAAVRPETWQDYLPMSVSMAGICLPSFQAGDSILEIKSCLQLHSGQDTPPILPA